MLYHQPYFMAPGTNAWSGPEWSLLACIQSSHCTNWIIIEEETQQSSLSYTLVSTSSSSTWLIGPVDLSWETTRQEQKDQTTDPTMNISPTLTWSDDDWKTRCIATALASLLSLFMWQREWTGSTSSPPFFTLLAPCRIKIIHRCKLSSVTPLSGPLLWSLIYLCKVSNIYTTNYTSIERKADWRSPCSYVELTPAAVSNKSCSNKEHLNSNA